MLNPLFTVERTFIIRGRGLVLVGITGDQYASVKTGDPLVIQYPDGSVRQATVRAVEYPPSIKWVGEPPPEPRYGVLVELDAVPVGSVVGLASSENT